MDYTVTAQIITPLHMFVQVVSTVLLILFAVVAVKIMIQFIKSK
jgi:hypothetical protein